MDEKTQAALDKVTKRMQDPWRKTHHRWIYRDVEYFHAPEYPHAHEHVRLEYRAMRANANAGVIGYLIMGQEETPWGQQRIKLVYKLYAEFDRLMALAEAKEKTCKLCAKRRREERASKAKVRRSYPLNVNVFSQDS